MISAGKHIRIDPAPTASRENKRTFLTKKAGHTARFGRKREAEKQILDIIVSQKSDEMNFHKKRD